LSDVKLENTADIGFRGIKRKKRALRLRTCVQLPASSRFLHQGFRSLCMETMSQDEDIMLMYGVIRVLNGVVVVVLEWMTVINCGVW